ncbi:MAG: peptidoglycan-associated lipoprotein Pal [Pseudomonadota bacterium]
MMMRSFPMVALTAALALAGCSSKSQDPSLGGSGAGAGAGAGATGVSTATVDPASVEFFQVNVGDRVFFRTDSSDLTGEARAVLDRQAEWLRLNPQPSIVIEGHADERGTREYNLALGARRANAVQQYLVSRGVPGRTLRTVTYGKERPVEVCSQDQCWARNRRAVTAVQGAGS